VTAAIDVEIFGSTLPVSILLNRLELALSIPGTQVWLTEEVLPFIKERAADRFQNEGDDVSGKWAPLSQVTVEIRQSQGFGAGPINSRSGDMERYITGSAGRISGRVMTYPDYSIPSGSDGYLKDKIETAQSGRRNPSTVPRPVLGLGEEDLAWITTSFATYIALAGAGASAVTTAGPLAIGSGE